MKFLLASVVLVDPGNVHDRAVNPFLFHHFVRRVGRMLGVLRVEHFTFPEGDGRSIAALIVRNRRKTKPKTGSTFVTESRVFARAYAGSARNRRVWFDL